jgi:alpha-mannosidase
VSRRAVEARHPILPVFPKNLRRLPERILPEENSFMLISPATVQCSAFYREKGKNVVRVYESAGSDVSVSLELPFRVRRANEVNFNGSLLTKPITVSERTVRFDIKPWEIVTLSID